MIPIASREPSFSNAPVSGGPPARTDARQEGELSSERLLGGRREILIRHGDRLYRLRHTSNDKLILTK